MSNLRAFLKENAAEVQQTKKVYISDRFKDEEGAPVPFTIRLLSKDELAQAQNVMLDTSKKGKPSLRLDRYNQYIAVAGTVEPDLFDEELQNSYGAMTPHVLLDKLLTGPEFMALVQEITQFNKLDRTIDDDIEEAKNS